MADVVVQFLGSGDAFGSGARDQTCIYVDCPDFRFLIDKKIKFHMDYATLMRHRPELGCRRLVVTHMGEDMLARIRDLEAETAEDGKRVVL